MSQMLRERSRGMAESLTTVAVSRNAAVKIRFIRAELNMKFTDQSFTIDDAIKVLIGFYDNCENKDEMMARIVEELNRAKVENNAVE